MRATEPPRTGPALIVIGGLPATGKSTVGRAVARRFGASYLGIDTIRQSLYAFAERDADTDALRHAVTLGLGYSVAYALAEDLQPGPVRIRRVRQLKEGDPGRLGSGGTAHRRPVPRGRTHLLRPGGTRTPGNHPHRRHPRPPPAHLAGHHRTRLRPLGPPPPHPGHRRQATGPHRHRTLQRSRPHPLTPRPHFPDHRRTTRGALAEHSRTTRGTLRTTQARKNQPVRRLRTLFQPVRRLRTPHPTRPAPRTKRGVMPRRHGTTPSAATPSAGAEGETTPQASTPAPPRTRVAKGCSPISKLHPHTPRSQARCPQHTRHTPARSAPRTPHPPREAHPAPRIPARSAPPGDDRGDTP